MSKYLKILIPIAIIAAVAAIAPFLFRKPPVKPKDISLEIWNLWDDSDAFSEIIADYAEINENVKISYYKKNYDGYEDLILNSMAEGDGPDIFLISNNWAEKYKKKIVPMPENAPLLEEIANPQSKFSALTLKTDFLDVVSNDAILDDSKIYALPLSIDTLALYYNKDLFNNAGIPQPPKTWEEFKEDVSKLRLLDDAGSITKAGAAIGTASNISRSADILYLLMLQSGTAMVSENHSSATFSGVIRQGSESFSPGATALKFYADFANPKYDFYTWNPKMENSADCFAQKKCAMVFGYSYLADEIKLKSPYLNFAIAKVPQISGASMDANYANYWMFAVSRLSTYPAAAWDFLKFASSKAEVSKHLAAAGKLTARKDLVLSQVDDPKLQAFASQLLTARSWFQKDPEKVDSIFADMISDVNYNRKSLEEAIKYAEGKVTQVLK